MAHLRNRFLLSPLKKMIQFSPIVGVLGHRQVGKTTLISELGNSYFSFDDEGIKKEAEKDPKKFLAKNKKGTMVIDECQMVPKLFPALKEHVRLNKRPGQFILSGSVRFTSRKAIRESLTGRIINLELLPFTVSELEGFDLPETALKILNAQTAESAFQSVQMEIEYRSKLQKSLAKIGTHGGLPGVCFIREDGVRHQKLQDQIKTQLDRDVRLIYPTTLAASQIFEFAKSLSKMEGAPLNYTQLMKETDISYLTIKKLIHALEAIFMIRVVSIEGDFKGPVVYFEDGAETRLLADNKNQSSILAEGILFRHLLAQFNYRLGEQFRIFQFLSRGGVRVPLAVECKSSIVGFIFLEDSEPKRAEAAAGHSFLKQFNNSKIIYITNDGKPTPINSRALILPRTLFV